jgi:phosphonate transport system ATP-binding protein
MLLRVRNVTRLFGTKAAVDNMSFDVATSGFVGIIGRSGAGKSTFLRMMNRLTDASRGEIHFDGQEILTLQGADKRAWQSQCAMIFQQCAAHGCGLECAAWHPEPAFHAVDDVQPVAG